MFQDGDFGPVVHLAAQAGVRYSLENPDAYLDANLAAFLEGLGAAMQVVDDPRPITGLVGGRARVDLVHPMTQGVIEENCDLARGRGDRLDLPDARGTSRCRS